MRTSRIGLLFLAPAAAALIVSYVVPSVATASRIASLDGAGDGLGRAALLAVLPVLTMCVTAPLLAWLAHRGGTAVRRTVRLALALPTVLISPVGLLGAWQLRDGTGGGALPFWLTLHGLLTGVGVTLFLAALRRPDRAARQVRAVLAVGVVAGLAVLAYGLQAFYGQEETPLALSYTRVFAYLDLEGAAAADTVLGVLIGALGLAAVAVLAGSGLRADLIPVRELPARRPSPGWAIAAFALLLATLAAVAYGAWPWLAELGGRVGDVELRGQTPPGLVTAGTWALTWVPPLFPTVVGVVVAALGGYGIGALRPLGPHSEWLLMIFAPWLFAGLGPLAPTWYFWLSDLGLERSWPALVPPVWLSVPALVIFTLLFRGLAERRAAASAGLGSVLLPALPVAAAVGVLTYLVHTQDSYWQTIFSLDESLTTLPVAAESVRQGFVSGAGLALPVVSVIVPALLLGVLHWFSLDRLTLRTTELTRS